jgi:hypothetical protein
MSRITWVLCVVWGAGTPHMLVAQMRPDQPPTYAPAAPSLVPSEDVVGAFRSKYQAVGEPRFILFWNVSFDDATQSVQEEVEVTREIPAGQPQRQEDSSVRDDASGPGQLHSRTTRIANPAKYHVGLNARDAAQLEAVFREALRSAGVHLLDRATSIRMTAAQRDRHGEDPKLIETDAVLDKADVLLEIVLVQDFNSPLGRGFKVSATNVKAGTEMASIYTLAQPKLVLSRGHYVATDDGFVWQEPSIRVPTAAEVGATLADDVMRALGVALPAVTHK